MMSHLSGGILAGSGVAGRKLSTKDAADFLGLGRSTLEKFRVTGGGPPYSKLGKRVVYDVTDLERWVADRRVASASTRAPK